MFRVKRLQIFIIAAAALLLWEKAFSLTDTLPLPAEIRSVNGVLSVTLEARPDTIHLNDGTFPGFTYNGLYAGPVLRVHPGDTMRIKLINHLSEPTNLHFHGIQTSPLQNSDNIYITVNPGQAFDYEIKIPPFQPPGLYWYHAHPHGLSDRQIMGGLSGALMVEGFAAQFRELAGIKEQLLILKDYELENQIIPSVNGQSKISVSMRPGETQLWHISNQSADRYFHLSLKGHKFRIIGNDAVSLNREISSEKLDIQPASRMEVLVDAGEAGSYPLLAERELTKDGAMDIPLAQVDVLGRPLTPVPAIAVFPRREDLRTLRINAHRTITFTELNDDRHYFINGRQFDHRRADIRLPLGNVEEWTLKNDTDDMHVFHIHQVNFQVTEINGKPEPFTGYVDVVRVPERGAVKIILPFTNPSIVGQFVYHCHVVKHEDMGMMAHIEVYDPDHPAPSANGLGNQLPDRSFSLIDQNGRTVTEKDLQGKLSLLFFGYTECTGVCPTTLLLITNVLNKLGAKAKNVQPVFISIDTEHDNMQKMKTFLSAFHPSILGLTGTPAQVAKTVEAYGSGYSPNRNVPKVSEAIRHPDSIYLMDRNGELIARFTYEDPEDTLLKVINGAM
jgi:suppressor of ftsI